MDPRADFIARLIDAHRNQTRFDPDGFDPTTDAEIYEVQAAVAAALGPVGGFKVGRDQSGAAFMAPIIASKVVQSGAAVPAGDRMGIELEIGFEVLSSIPADASDADLARCVRPVPVIELVDTRFSGPRATAPLIKLTDMQLNQGMVLGTPIEDWNGQDFGDVTARLVCGSETVIDGSVTVPGGSALASLRTLVEIVGTHCGGIAPGQVIITGSLCGLPYFGPGTEVHGHIDGLGDVAVNLT